MIKGNNMNNIIEKEMEMDQIKRKLSGLIIEQVKLNKLKQSEIADILSIRQPRASDLVNCKTDKFSLEILVKYAGVLGITPIISTNLSKKGLDLTMRFSKPKCSQQSNMMFRNTRFDINKERKVMSSIDQNKINIMFALKEMVKTNRVKQHQFGGYLNIKQPRASDLLNIKHQKFSLDLLINIFIDGSSLKCTEKGNILTFKTSKLEVNNFFK